MLFYLVGTSALISYFVFQSRGIDYRAVGLGALLPTVIDLFVGRPSFGHSFLFPVSALVLVMFVTIWTSRLFRRQLLCVVIGIFLSLVLEGTFMFEYLWFWPLNFSDSNETMRLFPSFWPWIIRDVIGLIAAYLLFSIGELYDVEKRKKFLKSGRLFS